MYSSDMIARGHPQYPWETMDLWFIHCIWSPGKCTVILIERLDSSDVFIIYYRLAKFRLYRSKTVGVCCMYRMQLFVSKNNNNSIRPGLCVAFWCMMRHLPSEICNIYQRLWPSNASTEYDRPASFKYPISLGSVQGTTSSSSDPSGHLSDDLRMALRRSAQLRSDELTFRGEPQYSWESCRFPKGIHMIFTKGVIPSGVHGSV